MSASRAPVMALFCALSISASTITFSVTDLGVITGGTMSAGRGISSNGYVTGYADVAGGDSRAFLYQTGPLAAIGPAGSPIAFGNAVNSLGTVAGYAFSSDLVTYNAYLYNGSLVPIATLGGTNNAATGINDSGTVVGYSDTASGGSLAFKYSGGSANPLGTLPGGSTSRANGINAAGSIVGSSDTAGGATHAFLDSGGSWTDLGVVSGYTASSANAISNSGAVAGVLTDASFNQRAFLWRPGFGMVSLGTIGGDSVAFGVNSSNWVVGSSSGLAFLYSGSTLLDLNTLLDSTGSGWVLTDALAINDAGQITGMGYRNGEQRAFLLNLKAVDVISPEPAAWGLGACGLLMVCWKLRRRIDV